MARLGDICTKSSSSIKQSDLENCNGNYPIYGASGFIKNVDFYEQDVPYVAVVKDGAGIGRVMQLPAKSSVIGTMQYIIPNIGIDVSYLAYAMEFMNLSKYYTGATIPHIYFKDYCSEPIPEHSQEEQRHIAAVLDKVSDLIVLRKQQLAKLDELAKARFVEMFGDPEDNSKTWPIQPLEQLCSVGSSKRIYQNEQSADGVPFWRISDLVSKMDTDVADSGLFIPEKKYSELKQAGLVPAPGDILLTSRGTLGRCYIIKADDRFYFQDGMISWLSDYTNGITPLYLQYLFTMPGFRKQIDAMQAGSTVAYLSISMIKKLQVMVPSAGAQASFATFVAQVDKSKSIVQQGLGKLETLKSALMQEYFG